MYNTLIELFEDPKRWSPYAFALDANGKHVSSLEETAVSWCLLGGINKVYGYETDRGKEVWNTIKQAWIEASGDPKMTMFLYQETLTHAQFLAEMKRLERPTVPSGG